MVCFIAHHISQTLNYLQPQYANTASLFPPVMYFKKTITIKILN